MPAGARPRTITNSTMSNTTKKGYHNIHGVNPQALVEKVIRTRIYESPYWKEHCFALSGSCRHASGPPSLTCTPCPLHFHRADICPFSFSSSRQIS